MQANLAWLYEQGVPPHVSKDYEAAERYYKLAAKQGDVPSQRRLGDLYYYGLVGGEPNMRLAFEVSLCACASHVRFLSVSVRIRAVRELESAHAAIPVAGSPNHCSRLRRHTVLMATTPKACIRSPTCTSTDWAPSAT